MKVVRILLWTMVVSGLAAACGGSTHNGASGNDSGTSALDSAFASDSSLGGEIGPSPGPNASRDAANSGSDSASNTQAQDMGNGGDCTSCAAPTPVCCATQNGATCVADPIACPNGTIVVACSGTAGCSGGQVCCESGGATSCASACASGHQVCQASPECPSAMPVCDMNGPGMDSGYGLCVARSTMQGDAAGADAGGMPAVDSGTGPDAINPADATPPFDAAASE
jgi:hypothetical protein